MRRRRRLGKARPAGLQAAQIVAAGYKIGEAVEGAIPHPLFFGMTQEGQKRDSGYAFSQKAYFSVKEYV